MTPETKLIAVNLVFLGYAYVWAYPRLSHPTGIKIMWRDVVLTAAALMIGALLFAGTGTKFSLIAFDTNWFIFQLVIFAIVETPLFLWFAYKNDLEF